MSFIELGKDLNDVKEPQTVPEGMYDLVIANVKEKEKENKTNILVVLEILGNPGAANILHNISIPSKTDDEDKVETKLRFIKQFMQKFGLPLGSTIDISQFPGATARCKLILDEYNGVVSNKLKL